MSLLVNRRNEIITVWKRLGTDASGNPSYSSPIHISARFHEATNIVSTSEDRELVSDTEIFIEKTQIFAGDWVYRGKSNLPKPPKSARELKFVSKMRFTIKNVDIYKGIL